MLLMQFPWMEILATGLVVVVFMLLTYFGMYRFASKRYFLVHWVIMGIFMVCILYYSLRAQSMLLGTASLSSFALLFFNDTSNMKKLFNDRQ